MGLSRLIAVLAAGLLLAGCSSAPAPAGLTDEEIQLYVDRSNRQTWQGWGVEGETAPEVRMVRFVNADEWMTVFQDCLVRNGVTVEVGVDGGWSWSTTGEQTADQMGAIYYTCNAQYPMYPPQAGYLSDAQHAYLYDYYQDVLTPCLQLAGYATSGSAPTREAFNDVTSGDWDWSPYSLIQYPGDHAAQQRLESRCPSSPFRA